MGPCDASIERRERLAHILDVLNALSGVAARDGSDMLRYFVELAAAQARDEYVALNKALILDCSSRTLVSLH